MNSTTFSYSNCSFRLSVDSSKAIVTAEWLTKRACTFDRYVGIDTTRFVFIELSDAAHCALDNKFGTFHSDVYMPTEDDYNGVTSYFSDAAPVAVECEVMSEDGEWECIGSVVADSFGTEFLIDAAMPKAGSAYTSLEERESTLTSMADAALAKYPLLGDVDSFAAKIEASNQACLDRMAARVPHQERLAAEMLVCAQMKADALQFKCANDELFSRFGITEEADTYAQDRRSPGI